MNEPRDDSSGAAFSTNPLDLEYKILSEEQRVVNAQILHWLSADERGFEFTLVAYSAIVIASSVAVDLAAYPLLLLLTFPFFALSWVQARRGIVNTRLTNYILLILAPRIRALQTRRTAGEDQPAVSPFVFWEEYADSLTRGQGLLGFVMVLPHAGRIILQLSAALVLIIAYFLFRNADTDYVPSFFDSALLALNTLTVLATIVSFAVAARFFGTSREN